MTLTLHLYGKDGTRREIPVNSKPIRYSCAQESIGLAYIIVLKDNLPMRSREPELYENALNVDYFPTNVNPEEIILHYFTESPRDVARVILTTQTADDKLREEKPEYILQNELFRIDF